MIKINKINTKKISNAFAKYGDEAIQEITNIVQLTAQQVEDKAKQLAPIDNGTLRQSISSALNIENKGMSAIVVANQPYSAYHEFGTGGLVDVPEGWGEMAMQFKGKGIRQINIMPRPFMYPSYLYGKSIFNKDIKEALKYLNKKFNG